MRGGMRYATNGTMCVRQPTTAPDSPAVSPPYPDCAGLGWPNGGLDCPALPLPEPEKSCGPCDGTGRIACHVCGSGALCDDCFGTGDRLTTYRVGDSRLATRYIALLRAYGVTCVYQPRGAGWPYYFVGPGFTGLVMPCVGPDLHEEGGSDAKSSS